MANDADVEHDEGEHFPSDLEHGDLVAERILLDRAGHARARREDVVTGHRSTAMALDTASPTACFRRRVEE